MSCTFLKLVTYSYMWFLKFKKHWGGNRTVPKSTWVLNTNFFFSPWEEKMSVATDDILCVEILYTWNGITYLWVDVLRLEDVPLVEFMYLVFTRMQGESYRRQLRSLLLCFCDVFRALINSLVSWCSNNFLETGGGGLALFGTGNLHTWAPSLETLHAHLTDRRKINRRVFMDDSAYRWVTSAVLLSIRTQTHNWTRTRTHAHTYTRTFTHTLSLYLSVAVSLSLSLFVSVCVSVSLFLSLSLKN